MASLNVSSATTTLTEANDLSVSCPVCGSGSLDLILALPEVPVHCNVLCSSREEALHVPKAPIELVQCQACSHVFNRAFDPGLVQYSGHYENSLFYSPTFRQYAEQLAQDLVERHKLTGKTIIEVGAGDTQFLKLLCELGGNRGVAFDPSAAAGASATADITTIRDYYGERYAHYAGDFLCCRQVLEHIWEPISFLRMIRNSIAGWKRPLAFFEVPNAANMFAENRIWDVIYEHYSYFSPQSLALAFEQAGFQVTRVNSVFGGQYLCIEADGRAADGPAWQNSGDSVSVRNADEKLAFWRTQIRQMKAAGKRAVMWGAGSKGIMFLNMLETDGVVDRVIDLNPRKHGMFIAGTGQPIAGPETIGERPCDVVFVANSIYRTEIAQMLSAAGSAAEIVCI